VGPDQLLFAQLHSKTRDGLKPTAHRSTARVCIKAPNGQVLGQPSSLSLIHFYHQSIARCGSVDGPRYAAANRLSANAAAKAEWLVNFSAPSNIERHFNSPIAFAFYPHLSSHLARTLFHLICYAHIIYNGSAILYLGRALALLAHLCTNRQWQ
jgi:hypothetical protein